MPLLSSALVLLCCAYRAELCACLGRLPGEPVPGPPAASGTRHALHAALVAAIWAQRLPGRGLPGHLPGVQLSTKHRGAECRPVAGGGWVSTLCYIHQAGLGVGTVIGLHVPGAFLLMSALQRCLGSCLLPLPAARQTPCCWLCTADPRAWPHLVPDAAGGAGPLPGLRHRHHAGLVLLLGLRPGGSACESPPSLEGCTRLLCSRWGLAPGACRQQHLPKGFPPCVASPAGCSQGFHICLFVLSVGPHTGRARRFLGSAFACGVCAHSECLQKP